MMAVGGARRGHRHRARDHESPDARAAERRGRAESRRRGDDRRLAASSLATLLRVASARSSVVSAVRERPSQSDVSSPDPVHHRERGLRALQLLRDAQHPHAVPRRRRCCSPHARRAERARLAAKDVFHTFVIGVYFFPLLGGWLADRFFGKYNTILWFSLIYCVGQALPRAVRRQARRLLHRACS